VLAEIHLLGERALYDTPWKEIVTNAFPEFMAFYSASSTG